MAANTSEVVSSVAWWARDFLGGVDQVGEARHWIGDLLPECDQLADLLLLASELCTNAVAHTRSGKADGRFGVAVEWTPALARVVIEDQGAPTVPALGAGAAATDEFGRGLWLVDELADGWGTTCHPAGRVVWVDIRWQARGGPPLEVSGGFDAVLADITVLREAFPGTTIWWGQRTQTWWAALPGAIDASALISSPTRGGLSQALADVYAAMSPGRAMRNPRPSCS
jgi:anti-sigma regulatory factor (Ser/Thr protein kinase)